MSMKKESNDSCTSDYFSIQSSGNDSHIMDSKTHSMEYCDSGFESGNMSSAHSSYCDKLTPANQELVSNLNSSSTNSLKQPLQPVSGTLPSPVQRLQSHSSGSYSSSNTSSMSSTSSEKTSRSNSASMESGYGSGGSHSGSLTSSNQELTKSHVPTSVRDSSSTGTKFFNGTPEEFLQKGLVSNWREWDPVRDIRDRLSPQQVEEMRSIFWEQDEDDQDFEALDAARDKDARAVALAVFIAKDHKQLNTKNKDRQTILHLTVEFNCPASLVRLIITRGADGAIADAWGDTPLHIAARLGRADVIKALTTTLTKPEVRHPYFRVPYKSLPQDNVQSYNHDGRSPVHLAVQTANSAKHREALEVLKKKGRADMDFRRMGDGYAPAHIAIDNGDYECLHLCLQLGADSEVRNYKSETPQQLAYLCGFSDMVRLCQEFGAGAYQLEYAETEPVIRDEDDDCMDVDEEDCGQPMDMVSHRMERMAVG